jgi:flagellar basal-body rod protein FlgB
MNLTIESFTTATLSMALDAASVRQQVIAANIANAGRTGYVAKKVSFEAQLADLSRALSHNESGRSPALLDLQVRIEADQSRDGGPAESVQLDAQVSALAQNALHYQALVKGLSKHMAILASAATDGKR